MANDSARETASPATALIIERDPVLRDLLAFLVEAVFRVNAIEVSTGSEAILVLDSRPDLAFVICEGALGSQPGARAVFEHPLSKGSKVPFILSSLESPEQVLGDTNASRIYGHVVKPEVFGALKILISEILKSRENTQSFPQYCRIKTSTVLKFGILFSDLYIRLSEDKYLRVLREGDPFNASDFDRFDAKNVEYLYIRSEEAGKALAVLVRGMEKLAEKRSVETDEAIELSASALEMISEFNRSFGLTEDTRRLAQASISVTLKSLKNSPGLNALLEKLMIHPDRYIASHSVVLGHIACGLAAAMGWTSELTFYKLTAAAFIHDITLENNDLARVASLGDLSLQIDRFTPEQIDAYASHPQEAAALAASLVDHAGEIAIIVVQHHERPDGSGFPRGLKAKDIAPLAATLILAHEILLERMDKGAHFDLQAFFSSRGQAYSKGTFKELIASSSQALANSNG